jgi:hypothetical protein
MHAFHSSKFVLIATTSMLIAIPVRAEGPMATDDAGTLDKGGMKVEGVWSRDDQTQGGELLFGFSPVENLELEVAVARAKDDEFKANAAAFGAKWVPYQNDTGWSLGARFDYGRARVTERATSDKFFEREYALTGLASYRLENGQVLHLNLGAVRVKAQGESDTLGIWGIGYEFPLAEKLQLTVETYGAEQSRPDKAIGLRYEVFDGFKISGAVGRGNDRGFGQVGLAWEF